MKTSLRVFVCFFSLIHRFYLKLAGKIEQRTNDNPLKYVVKQSSVIKFNPVSDIFILNSIKQLKNGKALGPDKIRTILIKDTGEVYVNC